MSVTNISPSFNGKVGEALSVGFILPTYIGQSDDLITHWTQIPALPPGLFWDGTTITGTPTVAGTYELVYKYLATVERYNEVLAENSVVNHTEEFEWVVKAYITSEDDELPATAQATSFPPSAIQTITTNVRVYNFGSGGVSGESYAELANNLNSFFSIGNYSARAYMVGDQILISFDDGEEIEDVESVNEETIGFTEIETAASEFSNNNFFGKDNPTDTEYAWYTVIQTGYCSE